MRQPTHRSIAELALARGFLERSAYDPVRMRPDYNRTAPDLNALTKYWVDSGFLSEEHGRITSAHGQAASDSASRAIPEPAFTLVRSRATQSERESACIARTLSSSVASSSHLPS